MTKPRSPLTYKAHVAIVLQLSSINALHQDDVWLGPCLYGSLTGVKARGIFLGKVL